MNIPFTPFDEDDITIQEVLEAALSFFYCKQVVLPDGMVHTTMKRDTPIMKMSFNYCDENDLA